MEYKLNNFKMGLTGTHRTGKTTLAKHVAERLEIPFVATNASEVFKEFAVKPSEPITPLLRLEIQKEILAQSVYSWENHSAFVTDRTPIDFISYLLMDYDPSIMSDDLEEQYGEYIDRCFEYANQQFSSIVIVPQGLPVQREEWKGVVRPIYMNKQELVIRGCLTDPRNKVIKYVIDGKDTDLDSRGDAVIRTVLKNFRKAEKMREGVVLQ